MKRNEDVYCPGRGGGPAATGSARRSDVVAAKDADRGGAELLLVAGATSLYEANVSIGSFVGYAPP